MPAASPYYTWSYPVDRWASPSFARNWALFGEFGSAIKTSPRAWSRNHVLERLLSGGYLSTFATICKLKAKSCMSVCKRSNVRGRSQRKCCEANHRNRWLRCWNSQKELRSQRLMVILQTRSTYGYHGEEKAPVRGRPRTLMLCNKAKKARHYHFISYDNMEQARRLILGARRLTFQVGLTISGNLKARSRVEPSLKKYLGT